LTNQKRYRSYLLRLWQIDAQGESGWRASLEDPHTGEQLGFGNLERLFAFLIDQTSGETGSAPAGQVHSG
jgi:hypothetical protein